MQNVSQFGSEVSWLNSDMRFWQECHRGVVTLFISRLKMLVCVTIGDVTLLGWEAICQGLPSCDLFSFGVDTGVGRYCDRTQPASQCNFPTRVTIYWSLQWCLTNGDFSVIPSAVISCHSTIRVFLFHHLFFSITYLSSYLSLSVWINGCFFYYVFVVLLL